ncbi:hypothetical protein NFI96_025328 [Prochilodus magdalenae]|nr:hypothetical protein NFI96_025328 [Prochilodus magdalenae]
MASILSALDDLLFEEWVGAPPSLSTLQHTQVFITELCALSLETAEGLSLLSVSNQVQSLVESISQSADCVPESVLLTQALYLSLRHFMTDPSSCDSEAALIAGRWAEEDLPTEDLYLVEFLGTLTVSLQKVVGGASVFILKMEVQCLKLLLFRLTHLNGQESHVQSTEALLRLVQSNQWTPVEALTLLAALTQKYTKDAPITEVLKLVHVYDISPEWTDDSGQPLIQALDFDPGRFQMDFRKALRRHDAGGLISALAELKTLRNLDDPVTDMIKTATTRVLRYSENAPEEEPFLKDSFQSPNLDADGLLGCLHQLCRAVFDTKGWWPTVQHMLRWCVLVLTEKSRAPELFGVEEDPCVVAMFAATQVCMGNKLDIVLSSDVQAHERTQEWADFYTRLGISLSTNLERSTESQRDIYRADVVYGTMDGFVSDYLQFGLEAMETGRPERSCKASWVISKVRTPHRFIKALFQVLHSNLNQHTHAENKIPAILQKWTGKDRPSNETYVLTVLEDLLRVFAGETEREESKASLAHKLCLEILGTCIFHFQNPGEPAKELFQKVSNLVAQQLWSPPEALNLLVALTEHHHNEGCISIMKVLHLLETYQVSSEWTDKKKQSLLKLLNSSETKKLIQYLEESFRDEKEKSIQCLFDELWQMKTTDERTLEKSYCVVKNVTDMIKSGEIKKHTDVQQARNRSHSTDTEDLQDILAVLCNAVHQCNGEGKWWPRATQMTSWCLLALSDTGKLLEMGTGEGKSCVIAMFAVLRALRGEKVDVLSSSSVLCQRDAHEWRKFYSYFDITVDTNTDKTEDQDRKDCYRRDVVYGTIEAFAADHLRQVFEMKDIRPDRRYQCIIIDEVDSLLLDQGVQLTYLSSPMVSMQHLNSILAMIWGHVSQYGFLSTGHQTFVQGPPTSFFKAIFDSIDTEETEIKDPTDVLHIAEESQIVPQGFTEDILRSGKDELLRKLKTVSQDAMLDFFQEIEHYVPYGFTVYTLDDNGLLCLRKSSTYNTQDIPELTFLVLEEGLCCALYDSEEILIKPISGLISEKIQYNTNDQDKISVPGFLRNLIEKKMPVWVQNAFLAVRLREGREYVVENDAVCPVDFRSTGIVELNKKWGDGLQQFVEIKHQTKLSTVSTVTNYISNICFFEKYDGKIYGTTGTLGSETEIQFLQELYPSLSACKMPTFNRKKLFEIKETLKTSAEDWKSEITEVVRAEVTPNSYRGGRAALVICETINKAKDIYEELKGITPGEIPGKIILYCRSDRDSLSKMDKKLLPGDVIVATNLAGRGTDIKVSKQVNNNGGLFVILSFLSENTRVELQAFGRTARKGKPGSAQVIMTTDHLQEAFRTVSSLEEARKTRDGLAAGKITDMMNDVTEMKLREDLFSEYCETLQDIHRNTDQEKKSALVAVLNEFWGIWLQIKSEEIDQLKRTELQKSLKADLSEAKIDCQSRKSPCSSIYHYIKFGNIALGKEQWDTSTRLFERAMELDERWAAIAFYSHAYCTINQQEGDYLTKAMKDLRKAQDSLKYLAEESMVCLQFVKMSSTASANSNSNSLEKQLTTRCSMLGYFDQNIIEAINKLEEIKDKGRDAVAKKSAMFSLVSSADKDLQVEAYNLYNQGLKYVFAVEEEPRFPWEALGVFFLGVLQIIGGALLAVSTFGTLAQVGIGLITEGISDCISGIESMVKDEFSWKAWATDKAISIGISIIGFGVGKLIAKGFRACKELVKGFGKELKPMPKFLSKQAKDGLSTVARTDMRNAVKETAKTRVNKTINDGIKNAEEVIPTEILTSFKNEVKNEIVYEVKCKMFERSLAPTVDSIILSQLEDDQHLSDLLQDEDRKRKLVFIFKELGKTALQPFYADLSWQNRLNSSISTVINSAKSETEDKTHGFLTVIKTIHMSALAGDAISTMSSPFNTFFSNLKKELNKFQTEKGFSEPVKLNELSTEQTQMLKEFKQRLADTISTLLADALVDVFHQKFSSHVVSYVQGKVNDTIGRYVKTGLNSDRTEEKLRAGQNNRFISYMPVDLTSEHRLARESSKHSRSHAEKIRNSTTAGTILDIRVLSETTGTKVVILTQDRHGKLTKMQEVNPGTKPAGQTVTLVYRPKSDQYPDGHYDVQINNQTLRITSEDKSCLFHAFARGLKPASGEEEITLEANRLRSVEADILLKHSDQWEPFIKRKEQTEAIRGGDWFMAEGAARPAMKKMKETKNVLEKEVGKVKVYKDWKKYKSQNHGIGQFINADHQPPVSSILEARRLNQNSKLAEAMLKVATHSPLDANLIPNVRNKHSLERPAVYVPAEIHRKFLSTLSPSFRTSLATAMSEDDVVGTFKLTVLGAMSRSMLKRGYKNVQKNPRSKTRRNIFESHFQQHSLKMIQKWSDLLQGKGIMDYNHVTTLTTWITNQGYKDQNDPHRKQVSNLL